MVTYADEYWVGSIDDWKSTNRETFYLGYWLVSWLSKKQSPISLSYNRSIIHCRKNMLYLGSLDEENPTRYTSEV
jgi:hypothetical protein